MGSGSFDTSVYDAATKYRRATGTADFGYDADYRSGKVNSIHADLDPKGAMRESRDSDEHPESVPIVVMFDVTGSMGSVPALLQAKFPQLFGLILRKGYVEHPQILFGAIGDATCDQFPLQVGQFESDNRMDEQLRNIILERGGGGQKTESYELAAYFVARRTVTDAWEKRGRKGYFFMTGDEMYYPTVKASEVRDVIGDDIESINAKALFEELKERWNVYVIQPGAGSSYVGDPVLEKAWRDVLGQNYIKVSDPDAVAETIALTIGLSEGAIDLADGLKDLIDVGSSAGTAVGSALATIGTSVGAVSKGATPADLVGADSVARI